MKDILCMTCCKYVLCKNFETSFCTSEDLFTHTEKEECSDYCKGTPITEEEYDRGWCE